MVSRVSVHYKSTIIFNHFVSLSYAHSVFWIFPYPFRPHRICHTCHMATGKQRSCPDLLQLYFQEACRPLFFPEVSATLTPAVCSYLATNTAAYEFGIEMYRISFFLTSGFLFFSEWLSLSFSGREEAHLGSLVGCPRKTLCRLCKLII